MLTHFTLFENDMGLLATEKAEVSVCTHFHNDAPFLMHFSSTLKNTSKQAGNEIIVLYNL